MPKIQYSYESGDQIPEPFRDLYTETDGGFVLTEVEGIRTQKDVDAVSEALRKERNDHGEAKKALKPWSGLDPEDVRSKLDRYPELEAAADGKIDEAKLQEMVEARLGQKTGPLQRQIEGLATERDQYREQVSELQQSIEKRDRSDAVRAVAQEMKVHSTAIPDIEMAASIMLEKGEDGKFITKSGIDGVTPGLDVKGYLREMQKTRPHWWPQSEGGGAGGAGGGGFSGGNPWSAGGWNLTEQGRVFQQQGREQAERMARAAGSHIGATQPPKG